MADNDHNEAFAQAFLGGDEVPVVGGDKSETVTMEQYQAMQAAEGQAPPSRAPAADEQYMEENFLSSERLGELKEQFPEVGGLLKDRFLKIRELEGGLRELKGQMSAFQQMNGASREPEKPEDPWSEFQDAELTEYLSKIDGWRQRAILHPDDEEAKAEVAKQDPSKIEAVRRELSRREYRPELDRLRGEAKAEREQAEYGALVRGLMQKAAGDQGLGEGSPVAAGAQQEIARVAEQLGITDGDTKALGALAVMGTELARLKAENRGGAPRAMPAGLGLGGEVTRAAPAPNRRGPARNPRDVDADLTSQIDQYIENWNLI